MQDNKISRRELFTKILGANKKAPKFISPPYFCGEFNCEDCDAPCVRACKKELLSFESGVINFKFKSLGCDFCTDCAVACESIGKEVLNLKFPAKIEAKVVIDATSCLAWNQTICYNCKSVCKFKAIDFLGVFRPMINDRCTGCAECLEVCFKNSIIMEAI